MFTRLPIFNKLAKRMVKVKAFRGYLANPELANRILAPPYDVLNTEEARVMAHGNAHSFLHVNKPEIDLPQETNPYDNIVYNTGRQNLLDFISEGWLVEDDADRVFVYRLKMGDITQTGIFAGASVDDYTENRIKKHELTIKKKEEDRTRLVDTQSASTEPVFLTYAARQDIDEQVRLVTERAPFLDIVTDDGIQHVFWKCTPEESENISRVFEEVEYTYIADGHHRSASAYNVGVMRKKRAQEAGLEITGKEDFNFFLALYFPDNQLHIFDYNRVLKTLGDRTPEQFLEELKENFEVYEVDSPKPQGKHHFTLYLNNKWTGLRIKPEKITGSDPVSNLDSHLLTELLLKPVLGISDLRTDDRIDFVGGIRGLGELERRFNLDCVAAIAMYPVDITEVMAIADAGQIMPPKSTWFEPKPRSGFVVKLFKD
jgi:uncharacterized protein (DUF1015 family)